MLPEVNRTAREEVSRSRVGFGSEVWWIRWFLRYLRKSVAGARGGYLGSFRRHSADHGGARVLWRRAISLGQPREERRNWPGNLPFGGLVAKNTLRSSARCSIKIRVRVISPAACLISRSRAWGRCRRREPRASKAPLSTRKRRSVMDSHLMQGPGYDQESTPGLVGAGATVVVFYDRTRHDDRQCHYTGDQAGVEHAGLRAHVQRPRPLGRRRD